MVSKLRARVFSAAACRRVWPLLAAACVALAGCTPDGQPSLNAAQPRGATVAFESIDGPPPAQFSKLVADLNAEAQSRQLAVISRENPSAYRVRGYLAAEVVKHRTTISWVWDVFDRDQNRALRISGEETAKGRHRDAWALADDAMLRRIAHSSMDKLAAFLTSPEVAPGAPAPAAAPPQVALLGQHDTSPEAAGIFRLFKPQADPLPDSEAAAPPAATKAASVPLPRPRPTAASAAPAVSARETFTLAALRR
jgi:hypothetical protein